MDDLIIPACLDRRDPIYNRPVAEWPKIGPPHFETSTPTPQVTVSNHRKPRARISHRGDRYYYNLRGYTGGPFSSEAAARAAANIARNNLKG